MKKVPLTKGMFALVDDEDYESVMRFRWYAQKRGNNWYARAVLYMGKIGGKDKWAEMNLHRFILHPPKGKVIDHKNLNALDCRHRNMRICTTAENARNSRKQHGMNRRFTSKYKGVSWKKKLGKWLVSLIYNGKSVYGGIYKDEIKAARKYDKMAIKYFGEFANTNFTRSEYV